MRVQRYFALAALAVTAGCGGGGGGGGDAVRSQIRIVGSSTVYPFSTAVAEQFARASNGSFKAPVIEQNGTGAGLKLFCDGVGGKTPDIANASRRIKASEFEDCRKNGVNQIIEIPIGIDGLALIESKNAQAIPLTQADIYKALAANPYGKPNRALSWNQINPALPSRPILIFGPPPTSGTRDAFVELILTKGCESDPAMKALKANDEAKHRDLCTKIREDGVFVEAGENDNLLVQKVAANPGAIGVMGYSFLEENLDKVRGMPLAGIAPSYASIANFTYPGSRPLFLYVKGEHLNVIPGIRQYIAAFASAWGDNGYLVRRGLIALPADQQAAARAASTELKPLDPATLT